MEEEKVVEQENVNINNEEYLKLKRKNKKNKVIIIILAFVIILLLALVLLYYLNNKDKKEPENKGNESGQVVDNNENNKQEEKETIKYNNTFKYSNSGSYGIAYATGYAKVEKEYYCEAVPVAECNETNADETNEVVMFYVMSTESEDLKKEISENFGEQSKEKQSMQLGCVKNDTIEFIAFADDFYHGNSEQKSASEYYAKLITITKENSKKILSSSESNPITLKMEKLKLSTNLASDGYTCLSRMTSVEIVE